MQLRITIAMLEIRNRKTLQSKVNICKSDVKIGDYADSLKGLLFNWLTDVNYTWYRCSMYYKLYLYRLIMRGIVSLRTQPIAASSRSTIWSGGNGLRWVPPS